MGKYTITNKYMKVDNLRLRQENQVWSSFTDISHTVVHKQMKLNTISSENFNFSIKHFSHHFF